MIAKVCVQRRRSARSLRRRSSVNSGVDSIPIVVVGKRGQLPDHIDFVPEQGVVEELAANGSKESLDEGVRSGNPRHAAEVVAIQNPQVRQPLPKSEQRCVIRADAKGNGVRSANSLGMPRMAMASRGSSTSGRVSGGSNQSPVRKRRARTAVRSSK